MSTAWENLVAGSTLEAGSAWDHLTHQGGSGVELVYVASSSADMEDTPYVAEVAIMETSASVVSSAVSATANDNSMAANVQEENIEAEIL